jgi:hypothetical protein
MHCRYWRVPPTSAETTFPASRTTNDSPNPASNSSSSGTRESLHPNGDGGVLFVRQSSQDRRLARSGEMGFSAHEARIAGAEPPQGLVSRVRVVGVLGHGRGMRPGLRALSREKGPRNPEASRSGIGVSSRSFGAES